MCNGEKKNISLSLSFTLRLIGANCDLQIRYIHSRTHQTLHSYVVFSRDDFMGQHTSPFLSSRCNYCSEKTLYFSLYHES